VKFSKNLILGSLVVLFIFYFGLSGTAFQSRSGQTGVAQMYDGQTVQALLSEVQLLRLAIQQSNQTTPRIQIALERLRIQQEYVNDLTRDLVNVQDQIAESKNNQTQMAEILNGTEAQINKEYDMTRRAEMEAQSKAMRSEQERQAQREKRLQEREAQLAAQLQTEQSKLSGLNDQLDEWEFKLRQSKDKP